MKTKHFISAVLAFSMVFGMGTIFPKQAGFQPSALTASAADYTEGTYENLTYLNFGTYVVITGCDENAEVVEIPAEIDGLPVTEIGSWAFEDCESLTAVIISDSVTSIKEGAFCGCASLTFIDISGNILEIGYDSFLDCTNLTSINVSEQNSNYASIDGILYDKEIKTLICCPARKTSVTLPNSVTSIKGDAFYRCENLTSVTIPDSVTSIEEFAFYNCTNLTDIYYSGTEEEWNAIEISVGNYRLEILTIHYNSTAPEQPTDELEISVSSLIELNKALKAKKGAPKKFDLNGDGIVNIIDLALLKRALLSK